MIHTLDTITLADFIKMCNGDVSLAGDESESEDTKTIAAGKMAQEYTEIVGGKSLAANISRKNQEINNIAKIDLMDRCELLAKLEMWEELSQILKEFGFNINPSDKDAIIARIRSIRTSCMMKMETAPKSQEKEADKDSFVREMVMLDAHYKMHIDPNIWKAKEYAYLVKNFCEEMKASMKK